MSTGQPLTDLNQFPVVNPYSPRPQIAVCRFADVFSHVAVTVNCFIWFVVSRLQTLGKNSVKTNGTVEKKQTKN